jgi:hypothetical protein
MTARIYGDLNSAVGFAGDHWDNALPLFALLVSRKNNLARVDRVVQWNFENWVVADEWRFRELRCCRARSFEDGPHKDCPMGKIYLKKFSEGLTGKTILSI